MEVKTIKLKAEKKQATSAAPKKQAIMEPLRKDDEPVIPKGNDDDENIKTKKAAEQIFKDIQAKKLDYSDLTEEQRKVVIEDFNSKDSNKQIAVLLPDKVTDKYTEACKKEFMEYQNVPVTMKYKIGDKKNARKIADFLEVWNSEFAYVENKEWLGVLYFDKVIRDSIEQLAAKKIDHLEFDFNTFMYLNTIFRHQEGVGLKFAQWIKVNTKTIELIDKELANHADTLKAVNRKVACLRMKWSMACSGFKMKLLLDKLEDYASIENFDV